LHRLFLLMIDKAIVPQTWAASVARQKTSARHVHLTKIVSHAPETVRSAQTARQKP